MKNIKEIKIKPFDDKFGVFITFKDESCFEFNLDKEESGKLIDLLYLDIYDKGVEKEE